MQEKVIQGWIVYRKEVELMGFTKVFRIPRGVMLDRIKAKFNDDGLVLTISMPKSEKGISGEGIEEVEEAVDGEGESSGVHDEADGAMETVREELVSFVPETQEDVPEKIETEPREIEHEKQTDQQGPVSSEDDGSRHKGGRRRKFKICAPAIAGSTLLATLIVLVISLIKAKQR